MTGLLSRSVPMRTYSTKPPPTPVHTAVPLHSQATNAVKAFGGATTGPLQQGNRYDLDAHVHQYAPEVLERFTKRLQRVNRGYAINTDEDIPSEKVKKYMDTVDKVQQGKMSNAEAHNDAAADWWERGHYAGWAANRAAGLAEGAWESVAASKT